MKLLGKILFTLLTLLLITSIILWALAKNLNPETIKKMVGNHITTLTHKQSHIDGAISWQLFPRPGLKFSKIVVGDEHGKDEYSLNIDTMLLNLKITPLLRGNFVFSEVNIDGIKTLVNLNALEVPKLPDESANINNSNTSIGEQFAIERLLISHGQIVINKDGRATVFKNLQIGVDQFNLHNNPFGVQLKAKLIEYGSNALIKANINFKGRLSLAPAILKHLQDGASQSTAEGQLLLQNVFLNQFAINKISATIKTNKQVIQFNPFTLSLYNGESIGNMDYSIATQQFSLNQTATNLNGKQLMAVLLGHEMISGDLDYSIHAIIPMNKPGMGNITGKGSMTIKNGEIFHINIDQLLNALKEKLSNITLDKQLNIRTALQQLTDWDESKFNQSNTPFKLASIQYQFQNGMLNSDSILLQTDRLQIKGQGTLNLSNYELNSKLQASINSSNTEPVMQKIQQILGGYFPLEITGTLERPRVKPDLKLITPLLGQILMLTSEKPINVIRSRLQELMH